LRNALIITLSLAAVWATDSLGRVAAGHEPIVPGLNELVVLDPGLHERNLPPVILEEFEGVEGILRVDIPPKVHVHRYYYSGDKEFQGPIIQGGPTVVVANHPKTGEQMYVNVSLSPGAPRIAHSAHGITYVYPHQRVAIHFQQFPFDPTKAVVKYHSGQGVRRTWYQTRQHMVAATKAQFQQSAVVQSLRGTAHCGGDLVRGAGQVVARTGSRVLDGGSALIGSLPGVPALQSASEQRAEIIQAAEIRGADLRQRVNETEFLPTNR
jgi:hypothetical protein